MEYGRAWIIEHGLAVIDEYDEALTVRQLYYRLVAAGMTNDDKAYKRVVSAMKVARWSGLVDFDAFVDRERAPVGATDAEETILDDKVDKAIDQVNAWMNAYSKNRWENQPLYVEVWIEKKALQGVFERVCSRWGVALCPCKGYPSLTFLYEASLRFMSAGARGQDPLILYFGDYDPSGEDIPRSIEENLYRMGAPVEVERVALMEEQVLEWGLPPAPTKATDSRSRNWGGLGQVELDAVEPEKLRTMATDAVVDKFDESLYEVLMEEEEEEREQYQARVRRAVVDYVAEDDDEDDEGVA